MLLEPRGLSPNFEAIFGVAADHRLDQIRSRSRAGLVRGTFWEHEEHDLHGRLVARYESFEEVDAENGPPRPFGSGAAGKRRPLWFSIHRLFVPLSAAVRRAGSRWPPC
jgi:hypothetical protein